MEPPARPLFVLFSQHINIQTTPVRDTREQVQWVPFALRWAGGIDFVGIGASGFWVFGNSDNGLFVIDTERDYFFLTPMMERSISAITQEIRENSDLEKYAGAIMEAFPLVEIVRQGLQSKRDHWVGLALQWLGELSYDQRILFFEQLDEIRQVRSLSQKNRHAAQKALAKLKKERQQDLSV